MTDTSSYSETLNFSQSETGTSCSFKNKTNSQAKGNLTFDTRGDVYADRACVNLVGTLRGVMTVVHVQLCVRFTQSLPSTHPLWPGDALHTP